jgi:carboxylesterase type B
MTVLMGVPDKYVFDESMNERDCLNCNVFMPASAVNSAEEKLPVLVWLYGGNMRTGGNAIPLYGKDIEIP